MNSKTEILKEFEELFAEDVIERQYSSVFDSALRGELQNCLIRSICWRLFLNIFPRTSKPAEWKDIMKKRRDEYQELYSKYDVQPGDAEDDDLLVNNPLSDVDDSPWKQFWANEEIKREIDQDLERTHPEIELFQEKRILEIMQRVLFVHAKENPDSGYRQGMHEILAPILMIVDREKLEMDENELVTHLLDSRFVEADVYSLFSAIMEEAHDWFMVTSTPKPRQNHANNAVLGQSRLAAATEDVQAQDDADTPTSGMAPVLLMGQRIQNGILKQFDMELFKRLKKLEIEPQLYALKWVRLILSREFHLEDVIILWDAIFATSTDLDLLPYLCVAMLRFTREFLISSEQMFAMKRLLKFPPIENVSVLVQQAIMMRDGEERAFEIYPSLKPKPQPVPIPVQIPEPEVGMGMGKKSVVVGGGGVAGSAGVKPFSRGNVKNVFSQAAQSATHVAHSAAVATSARARSLKGSVSAVKDLEKLKTSVMRQGDRLDGIIVTLQREIFSDTTDEGVVLYALAELKQIRDILSLSIEDNVGDGPGNSSASDPLHLADPGPLPSMPATSEATVDTDTAPPMSPASEGIAVLTSAYQTQPVSVSVAPAKEEAKKKEEVLDGASDPLGIASFD